MVVGDLNAKYGIRLVHITPSGRGLRIRATCHADGMEATIERISQGMNLEAIGKVDPACKDLSRLSYLVPAEDILYESGLFDEVPEVSIEQMKQYQSTGTTVKGSNVANVGKALDKAPFWGEMIGKLFKGGLSLLAMVNDEINAFNQMGEVVKLWNSLWMSCRFSSSYC